MTERALLDFRGHGADQGVGSKRAVVQRTRTVRRNIGSDHVRHEATLDFPTEDGAHDGIGAQGGKHGEADF